MGKKSDWDVKFSEERPRNLVPAAINVCYKNCLEELSEELLVEILIRLPSCVFAFGCKCVSKRWLNLISSNFLISQSVWHHHHKNSERPLPFNLISQYRDVKFAVRTLVYSKGNQVDFASVGFTFSFLPQLRNAQGQPMPTWARIEGSRWDLLLLSMHKIRSQVEIFQGFELPTYSTYLICNPRAKQWVSLPPLPLQGFSMMALMCEPYCSFDNNHGNCRVQDTYRCWVCSIPLVRDESGSGEPMMSVFDAETQEWGKLAMSWPHCSITLRPLHTFVVYNGILHLLNGLYIMAFDPFCAENDAGVVCHAIDLPLEVKIGDYLCFGTCSGSLRLCAACRGPNNSHVLRAWDPKDYDTG